MVPLINWRTSLWLLLSTVLIPAVLTISVGILILVFYRQPWDVAFGVLVLCFAVFAVTGSSITVFLLRRQARLARLQTEFIANISHEFRTPLTSIRMFVETLRSGRIEKEQDQERCLDLLARETDRMERMVDQVLTFRQLERPDTASLSPHEPDPIVQQAIAPWTEVGDENAERLELVVEPDLPRILADPDTLMEAVRNLVSNALKYSSGAVVVTVRHDGEGVAVSVRDHGPAIPRREQKRIFKRFYRLEGTDKQGSGIGLAIAHKAAQAHGGSLHVKSTSGLGNVFTLHLPLVEVGPVETAPTPEHDREHS
jgi:two-component system phosphate regulon sensor histidine kinase PhoR